MRFFKKNKNNINVVNKAGGVGRGGGHARC